MASECQVCGLCCFPDNLRCGQFERWTLLTQEKEQAVKLFCSESTNAINSFYNKQPVASIVEHSFYCFSLCMKSQRSLQITTVFTIAHGVWEPFVNIKQLILLPYFHVCRSRRNIWKAWHQFCALGTEWMVDIKFAISFIFIKKINVLLHFYFSALKPFKILYSQYFSFSM